LKVISVLLLAYFMCAPYARFLSDS